MSSCSGFKGEVCPSRMNDGRAFTDYRPRCIINSDLIDNLRQKNVINSSYDSRMYLQTNADQIIQDAQASAYENLSCDCKEYDNHINGIDTMAPERYTVRCNSTSCYRAEVNPNGIGDGRNYF